MTNEKKEEQIILLHIDWEELQALMYSVSQQEAELF